MHDFLGWSRLSPIFYGYMTNELNKICENILVVQEGGYNVEYLG
jgi:acetoin utilization deacetylase AcuC-like enzyme